MASLLCTVRGCYAALRPEGRTLQCPRRHSFDIAASGYVNLLQPQDRRSRNPGDSREAAQARRRLADAGYEEWLFSEILSEIDLLKPRSGFAVCDVGCGEGSLLGALARTRTLEPHGIDISVPAIDLAAKRYPEAMWVVGNADRFLPWADRAFDFVTSVTARRSGPELRRVLKASGRALVAISGPDDLIELREAVLGRGERRDRAPRVLEELRSHLDLISRRPIRRSALLDANAMRDLLAATYRGARFRERSRAEAIGAREVTMSRDLLLFRR